jgi:hypothetical protein
VFSRWVGRGGGGDGGEAYLGEALCCSLVLGVWVKIAGCAR